MSEEDLRTKIIIPVLTRTPGIEDVTDVHGRNEKGLDVIFFTRDAVGRHCYGLQLKVDTIGGGGSKREKTVKQIIDQLELAQDFTHPVAVGNAGKHTIDRFVVATSRTISETARFEIAERNRPVPVTFWDGNEIVNRIQASFPELLSGADAEKVEYLKALEATYDRLDALDQLTNVQRRTLSQIYEESYLRRRFDPVVGTTEQGTMSPQRIPALSILLQQGNAVVVAEQNDGKTSMLRMLAIKRAREILGGTAKDHSMPVIVRAPDVADKGSVDAAIQAELARLDGSKVVADIETDLHEGNLFLCVDGFSELAGTVQREACELLIGSFADTYPATQVVVAGRPEDFLEPKYFPQFVHYTIVPFDERQTKALITKWASDIEDVEDVAQRMVHRVREALQLPGSPIPAIIGVLVYSEENKYITNTADAVDRYMVIRLGRYAKEMGVRTEVDWARKQDLLAEVAFLMVDREIDGLAAADMVERFNTILDRLGEARRGGVAVRELVESGVLVESEGMLGFHRTAFRDFFAAQHVFRRIDDPEQFFVDKLLVRKWGAVLMFAAGLRRHNSKLLDRLTGIVEAERTNAIDEVSSDYIYASYLIGRLLSNSEGTEAAPRLNVLRTCLAASSVSLEQFTESLKEDFGNIGEVAALLAVDQTFFVTVGVPWLENQFRDLAADERLPEAERLFATSVHAQLGCTGWLEVLEEAVQKAVSTKSLMAYRVLLMHLERERKLKAGEHAQISRITTRLLRKLAGREKEVKRLLEVRSRVMELEIDRLKRLG
jgi:hypothetical protein